MKKVVILYNQPLSYIQGINYVNNSFVEGNDYFRENGLELTAIYAPDGRFDCCEHKSLITIGKQIKTVTLNNRLKIKKIFNFFFPVDNVLWSAIRLYVRCYSTAKKAVRIFLNSGESPDYIIFQDPQTVIYYYKSDVVKNAKTILILHCSDDPLEQAKGVFPGIFKSDRLTRRFRADYSYAMERVDKIVYLSKHAVDASNIDESRKICIFNGVPDISLHELKDVNDPLNFVSVGSLVERKGQYLVLEALSLLDLEILGHLHYYIVGDGEYYDTCKNIINKNKLSKYVTLMGRRNDISEILKDKDVFILPSGSEGMPMSVIEAMRQGLYIIGTDTGGIPEMIYENYGCIVKRNAADISFRIKEIVINKVVTIESKKMSRHRYETDFSLKQMIDRYSNLLQSM